MPGGSMRGDRDPRRRRDLALGVVPLLGVAGATAGLLALPSGYFATSLTLYAVQVAVVAWSVPDGLPGPGLGPANRVTLLRSALSLPVVALLGWPAVLDDAACWWVIGVTSVAMALDGVDGWLARRTGTGTDFGARWDMELDSFLLLGLSGLVWLDGRLGAWVLLIGGLRYLFVAAGWLWPVLRGDLPPSVRRKTACVVQGIVLLVCLGPIIPAQVAAAAAAAGLAFLVYSFGADVIWLARTGDPG